MARSSARKMRDESGRGKKGQRGRGAHIYTTELCRRVSRNIMQSFDRVAETLFPRAKVEGAHARRWISSRDRAPILFSHVSVESAADSDSNLQTKERPRLDIKLIFIVALEIYIRLDRCSGNIGSIMSDALKKKRVLHFLATCN